MSWECSNTFKAAIPRDFAVMADDSTAYGTFTCGEFSPVHEDVLFCDSCQAAMDKAHESQYEDYMDMIDRCGPEGEDAPQPGNPEYNRGF